MCKIDASIIIPVKNGEDTLPKVMESIMNQETSLSYEIIAIDSGSKDKTLEILKKYPVRIYEISPEEFGHGKTRTYGASLAKGEFILFITQDAIPASKKWLENMIVACDLKEDIAGVFGIHYPYPDCNPLDYRDITYHFKGFGNKILIQYLDDKERYKVDEGYRHWLGFFSDNNSCIRKSVFEKYPYADVNFAEDQIWARMIIEKGYKKAYTPYAPVYHSHNYNLKTYFKRYFDEYKGLYDVYGYRIVKSWIFIIPGMLKSFINDYKYLKCLNYEKEDMKKWTYYSFVRNFYKYVGGYLGGRYKLFPKGFQKILNKIFSLQYQHRKA